jgi:mannose-6-phosphate isomerase
MTHLRPYISEKLWGYEQWLISSHPAGQSTDSHGRLLSELLGSDYPLLVKVIQADQTLSVQVHPDDDFAVRTENARGKTECWFVLDAKSDSWLLAGFAEGFNPTPEQILADIRTGTLEKGLKKYPVRPGDFLYIPAGTVHAIGGGVRILEIQQSSDITYRLYDWGRGRELHIEKGLQAIKPAAPLFIQNLAGHFECPYFKLNLVDGKNGGKISATTDFFLVILAGAGVVENNRGETLNAAPEDAIFCPRDEQVRLPLGMRGMQIRAK